MLNAEVLRQNGFVQVKDLCLKHPRKTLRDIVESIAKPFSHCGQPLIMDVRPAPGFQSASYAGTGRFDLHTDCSWHPQPARLIAMLCIELELEGGGKPVLVDGTTIVRLVSAEERQSLEREPVEFSSPTHINVTPLQAPVLRMCQDTMHIRFRRDLLIGAPTQAINHFAQLADENSTELHVEPGTLFVIDNWRMLHGRTALRMGFYSNRHFLRMYANFT